METLQSTGQAVGLGSPPQTISGSAPVGAAPQKSTEEQRAKWREKNRLAWLRKSARAKGLPDPVPPVALPSAPPPGQPGDIPGVPWDPGVLAPFWQSVVPEVEKLDVASLAKKAVPLGEAIVAKVKSDAPWNPVAKATLISTGPHVTAAALNAMGLSAEHAPTVAFVGAVGAILTGRTLLMNQLERMVAEARGDKAKSEGSEPLRKGDYHD